MSLQQSLIDLVIVSVIAALTPIVAGLLSRLRVPQAVIFIVGGILIGPQVLGWADPAGLELVSNVGLGFLFLLAGYELELRLFRERAGRLALTSWLVTLLVAIVVTGALAAVGLRPCVRADRDRPDHDRAGHPIAHPARQPDAGGPVRWVHHGCRSGWGVPPHRGRRGLPQRQRRVPWLNLPCRHRGRRAAVYVRPASGTLREDPGNPLRG